MWMSGRANQRKRCEWAEEVNQRKSEPAEEWTSGRVNQRKGEPAENIIVYSLWIWSIHIHRSHVSWCVKCLLVCQVYLAICQRKRYRWAEERWSWTIHICLLHVSWCIEFMLRYDSGRDMDERKRWIRRFTFTGHTSLCVKSMLWYRIERAEEGGIYTTLSEWAK